MRSIRTRPPSPKNVGRALCIACIAIAQPKPITGAATFIDQLFASLAIPKPRPVHAVNVQCERPRSTVRRKRRTTKPPRPLVANWFAT